MQQKCKIPYSDQLLMCQTPLHLFAGQLHKLPLSVPSAATKFDLNDSFAFNLYDFYVYFKTFFFWSWNFFLKFSYVKQLICTTHASWLILHVYKDWFHSWSKWKSGPNLKNCDLLGILQASLKLYLGLPSNLLSQTYQQEKNNFILKVKVACKEHPLDFLRSILANNPSWIEASIAGT